MIDITNVVTVSVSAPPAGLAPYSVNNLACFTKDVPTATITNFAVYTNPTDVKADWGSGSTVYAAAAKVFAQSPNILTGGGRFIVIPMVGDETLADAIARVKPLVFFGGCSYTFAADLTEVQAAAEACQAVRKLLFVVSSTASDLQAAGMIFVLQGASLTYARCLYHTVSAQAEGFKWGYAGRAMSTNFSGSNTTQTMNLKQIAGVTADSGLTETSLTAVKAVGADVYANIAGRASVLSHGTNGFFDDVYNLAWFVSALEVSGFNALAQTSTKIPQTEAGVDVLKGAYRSVCETAIKNRFVAPGKWTSADTFGDPEDFARNIAERGYYIYSVPVSEQPTADREARQAPVCQCAVKYAGATHSASLIVNFNR